MGFDLNKLLRPNIASLVPYSSARDEYSGEDAVFLDANENPYNLPYNRYPDPHQNRLKEAVSGVYEIAADRIFLGNGSDEAIDLLFRAFCEPGSDEVIAIDPSYGMYEVSAKINDIRIKKVSLKPDFSLNDRTVLQAAGPSTKMVFLCSPNNPTSNLLEEDRILTIAGSFPGLVVVDEAYIEFSGQDGLIHKLGDFENLVILRTFSKAWGMAGIRLGMAFASPRITSILDKIKYPYNINILTQQYALRSLDELEQKEMWIREIVSQRHLLEKNMKALPFVRKIFPSDANFLLVKVEDPVGLYKYLRDQQVIVRDRSKMNLCEGCLRITVGTPEENTRLMDLLRRYRTL